MKKISILVFSLLLFIASSTTVYADNEPIMFVVDGDTTFYVQQVGESRIDSFIPTSDNISFTLIGNNLKIQDGATEYEVEAVGDGVRTFKQWLWCSPTNSETVIESGDSVPRTNIKSIIAEFNAAPPQIIFVPNISGITCTTTPENYSTQLPPVTVTMAISYDPNTIQLDYLFFDGVGVDAVTKNGTTVSFDTPPSGDVTVNAHGGIIVKDVNITVTLPTEGDTTFATPSTSGAGYSYEGGTIIDLEANDVVSATNPIVAGKQYGLALGLKCNDGYSFKYTGDLLYSEASTSDEYKYAINAKVNGETIPPFTDSLDAASLNGYTGAVSSAHNTLTVVYTFTATEAPTPTNPGGSGGSSASYDHPIPNTGVK